MKTRFLIIISVLSLVLVSCSNSADQNRIAQLERELAQLKNANVKENVSSSEVERDYSSDNTNVGSDNSSSRDESGTGFVGEYEFVDKVGVVWVLIIKNDNTATFNIKGDGYMYYASWDDSPYNVPCLKFSSWEDSPYINFQSGKETINYACVTDEFIYESNSAFCAKNPRKRLPIKKVK